MVRFKLSYLSTLFLDTAFVFSKIGVLICKQEAIIFSLNISTHVKPHKGLRYNHCMFILILSLCKYFKPFTPACCFLKFTHFWMLLSWSSLSCLYFFLSVDFFLFSLSKKSFSLSLCTEDGASSHFSLTFPEPLSIIIYHFTTSNLFIFLKPALH